MQVKAAPPRKVNKMVQPTNRPIAWTITAPKWFNTYWRSVEAGRYEPVARTVISAIIVVFLIVPWIWGIANIAESIAK